MNKGMLTVGIIILTLMALLLINVISNYSTGSEVDYYLVKETANAAMQDSIDYLYYRKNGLIRMDKEEFIESFLCRFADSVNDRRSYKIGFYDMNEVPPVVNIKVDSLTTLNFKGEAANISTKYTGIIESNYKRDAYTEYELQNKDSSFGKGTVSEFDK